MTHELKQIITALEVARAKDEKAVLASVVDLDGSSYRRPGVRMLILQNGSVCGAVSGGCVEKEISRQAQSIFDSGIPRMMTYDGRFRLGCEGILYVLLEPLDPPAAFFKTFRDRLEKRAPIRFRTAYSRIEGDNAGLGTVLEDGTDQIPMGPGLRDWEQMEFRQELAPCLRLEIFGGEHDAVQMTALAALSGWEVCVTVAADESKTQADFPGATGFRAVIPDQWEPPEMDGQTAVLLMTHSFTKDLKYLLQLRDQSPGYMGVLGPASRRERLLGELFERHPETGDTVFDNLRGPAGIDIGSETPQEIALSILAEILAVFRNATPIHLTDKKGTIHAG